MNPDAVTLDQMIAEMVGEIVMRKSVYGRLVANGRMKQAVADRKIKNVQAVLKFLERTKAEIANMSACGSLMARMLDD